MRELNFEMCNNISEGLRFEAGEEVRWIWNGDGVRDARVLGAIEWKRYKGTLILETWRRAWGVRDI